jgi:uncharacterized protein (TIGR03118 family)
MTLFTLAGGSIMRNWFHTLNRALSPARVAKRRPSLHLGLESLEDRSLPSGGYLQTNLVADTSGIAANTDSHLINPWGLAYGPSGPFWVADNNGGVSTLYGADGSPIPLVVTIPPASGTSKGSPVGIVFNYSGSGFDVMVSGTPMPSAFLWASLDGVITGWAGGPNGSGSNAGIVASNPGASYTGLALDADSIGRNLLYAADSGKNTIDVYSFDSHSNTTNLTTVPGGFIDPAIKSGAKGYTVFNIQNLGGLLYVTYTRNTGSGGLVDVFNSDGVLQQHLIQNGALHEPWGLAMAPSNFGAFSNDLLVGNNGDGGIHAYNPHTGAFVGTMMNGQDKPLVITDLWALKFGNGGAAGPRNTLFFDTGVDPVNEQHGLFGSIQAIATLKAGTGIVPNLGGTAEQTFSTEQPPQTGDQNPYGVAFVPKGVPSGGKLVAGGVLASNFNANGGAQGTGSSIVEFGPNGQPSVFFQGQAGLGLTTALSVLKSGFVIVGNAPNNNSTTSPSVTAGSLLVIDKTGNLVLTIDNASLNASLVNGPWDMAVHDMGNSAVLFVSNVLTGTITRITLTIPKTGNPTVKSAVQMASGYAHATNSAALNVGPTGLVYNSMMDTLYVASTADNGIFSIAHASTTTDKGKGAQLNTSALPLNGPLGLAMAPNGDLIVTNGDAINTSNTAPAPNMIIEFTPAGKLVGTTQVDTGAAGGAFGIAVSTDNGEVRFAAVDDNTNTLDVWTFM